MNIIYSQVLIQAAVFLIVWFLLNKLFFKPFIKVYEKRNLKTIKAIEESKLLNKESEDLEAELKRRIDDTISNANKVRMSVIEEAKKKRESMLKQANESAQANIRAMREQIEKEKEDIINRLDADIKQFVPLIARKMMLK